jgi:protein-disulfide isomerase
MRYAIKRLRFTVAALVAGALLVLPLNSAAQEKAAPKTKIISSIQGISVTEEELGLAASAELDKLEMQKLQFEANYERSRYQVYEKTLQRIVEEKLLNAEAAKRGISSVQLLADEVEKDLKDPSDQEVNAFYEANKARINLPKEQVAPQIRQYLKQQSSAKARGDLIEKLKKANGVSYSIEPLRTNMESAGFPARGPAAAPVTIVEFSDFQCTYCKGVTATLMKVLQDFSADVRVVFRQFPLSEIHPAAQKAAEASLCAGDQGKFWEMHDLMFREQANIGVADLKAKAARLSLNTATFDACLDSARHAEKILKDLQAGARVGVTGTPALFINGRFLSGARPYEEIAALVKDELQRRSAADRPKR